MCGRYTLHHGRDQVEDFIQVALPAEYAPRYNIAPAQPILIIRENPHRPNGLDAAHVVWGLIPPWADDIRIGSKMINARCETAAEKPSFRYALRRRRCVVPVSGFYEWQKTAATPFFGAKKQPYLVTCADGDLLALGGIWETWDGPNGEQIESCAILTTAANGLLSSLYDRMPVVVPADRIPLWLDTSNEDVRTVETFFDPAPDDVLTMRPVSTQVNCVKNDNVSLIASVDLL